MSEEDSAPKTDKTVLSSTKPNRNVFRATRKTASVVPSEITNDPELIKDMAVLPQNYDFEIPKTIWRIKKCNAKCVALQFPEKFSMFSKTISEIIEKFTGVLTIIMKYAIYGACCIDDITARALGADFLVLYGHSCLIPMSITKDINILYVTVDITIDAQHAIQSIEKNFDKSVKLALTSTIQFIATLQHVASDLKSLDYNVEIPQCKPLSPGEVLGCTSPKIKNSDVVVFIGDERFHLESVMIANPQKKFFRYNPYDKTMKEEEFDYEKMVNMRKSEVDRAASCEYFGVILGTFGRQGSTEILENIEKLLHNNNKRYVTVSMPEVSPIDLKFFTEVEAWVQIACPRLSIDWGYSFEKPLLTPYELFAALNGTEWREQYPMDYYASESSESWTPNYKFDIEDLGKMCISCDECTCSNKTIK